MSEESNPGNCWMEVYVAAPSEAVALTWDIEFL